MYRYRGKRSSDQNPQAWQNGIKGKPFVAICREWDCRVTLVVYPWPDNFAAGDRDSIQVTHWRAWAASRNVRFIDGFAPFFREPAEAALRKYFIAGDTQFAELGNRRPFDEVRGAVGDY